MPSKQELDYELVCNISFTTSANIATIHYWYWTLCYLFGN